MGEAAEINQCRKRSREVVGTGALSTCRHAALGNWEVSYTALWVYRRVLSFCSANETFFFSFLENLCSLAFLFWDYIYNFPYILVGIAVTS